MEILVLLAIVIPAVMLIGAIMGMTAHSRIGRLEGEIKRLSFQISQMQPDAKPRSTNRDSFVEAPPIIPPVKSATIPPVHEPKSEPKPDPSPIDPPKRAAALESRPAKVQASPEPYIPAERPSRKSLEQMLGAQWSVWVGGLALAIGALFLLRFTIEAGVFTPVMRVGLAALMGLALLAAGEWLRRHDGAVDRDGALKRLPQALKEVTQNAYIPGVLTGVGIFALLGAAYAAYALYGFIGPITAFAILGAISLGGLGLGVLHGPKMAGLGLLAALITPLLVTTSKPQYLALFLYLLIVGCAAIALSLRRDWPWLKLSALFGLLAWGFIAWPATQASPPFIYWVIFLTVIFAANIWVARKGEVLSLTRFANGLERDFENLISWLWTAGAALLLYLAAEVNDYGALQSGFAYAGGFGLIILGFIMPRQKWLSIIGAVLAVVLAVNYLDVTAPQIRFGSVTPELVAMIAFGLAALAFLITALKYIRISDNAERGLWAVTSTVLPLLCLLAFALHRPTLDSYVLSGLFAALAICLALATERQWRDLKTPDARASDPAIYIYTLGTAAAYIFALDIALSWTPQSLALMASIILCAALYRLRAIWVLRPLVAVFAALTAVHVLFVHILPGQISTSLVFNELWVLLALPAILSLGAAWLLSRSRDDLWSEGMKAFVLTFAALFLVFQIHHIMNQGIVNSGKFGFDELALQVLVGFSVSLGGARLSRGHSVSAGSPAHEQLIPGLTIIASVISLAVFGFGICLTLNPLLNSGTKISGGILLNSLTLGYLLPAGILGVVAYMSRKTRPAWYVRLTGGLSLLSILIYLTASIRRIFTGADMSVFENWPRDTEMYTISAVWLVFGIALLALGIRSKRVDLRAASAAVIVLTVLKTFLIDLASLQGVLRAVSFVILGIVLIVIGRVYQRFMFSETERPEGLEETETS